VTEVIVAAAVSNGRIIRDYNLIENNFTVVKGTLKVTKYIKNHNYLHLPLAQVE